MKDDTTTDPKENPVSDGHLPGSGEIGGPVSYHDPATTDTNDNPDDDPVLDSPDDTDQPEEE
jgi:hypothetical protein